jgi:hypothetical protein
VSFEALQKPSSATAIPNILELEKLLEKSKFIVGIVAPKNGRADTLKTMKKKSTLSRTPM